MLFCRISLIILFVASHQLRAESLRVVTEHFPPYQLVENGKIVGGTSIVFINAMLKQLDLQNDIEVYPWARAYKMALNKPNVLIFTIARTPQREQLFHWIGDFNSMDSYLWSLKNNYSLSVNTLDSAKNYIVGVPKDDNTHHFLKQRGFTEQKNLYTVRNRNVVVQMLFKGRVDLIMGAENVLRNRIENLGYAFDDLQKVLKLPANDGRLSIAMSKETPIATVRKFQAAFKQVKNRSAQPSNK